MENRLIFRSKNSSSEIFSETVEFGDGRREYLKIAAMIDKTTETDVKDPDKFNEIVDRIALLYKNLKESPGGLQSAHDGGNFFRELFISLRDKFQVKKILERQDFRFKDAMLVVCLADPEGFLDSLIQKRPGKWTEGDIKIAANYAMSAANFYAFQNFVASEKYIRDAFTKLHQHYDASNAQDESFKTMFEYQKDHFELTVSEDAEWLGSEGKAKLTETAKQLHERGKTLTTEVELNDVLAKLGTINGSKEVEDILDYAGKFPSYKSDKHSKPKVFLTLVWAFYQGLINNPGVSDSQRKLVHSRHNEVFKDYPQLMAHRKSYFAEQRTKTSETVAESALNGDEAKELKKLSSKIQEREQKLLSKRPKKIHVKPDDFGAESGRFALSATKIDSLPPANESSVMVVLKIDSSTGDINLDNSAHSAKELDPGQWQKLFSVDANADQKAIITALTEAGVPQKEIDQIFQSFGQIPDELKPFARIVPSIENGRAVPNLILDQKLLAASLTAEIETILETLDFKPSDLDDPSRIVAEAERKFGDSLNSLLCQMAPGTANGDIFDTIWNFLAGPVDDVLTEGRRAKGIVKIVLIIMAMGAIRHHGWRILGFILGRLMAAGNLLAVGAWARLLVPFLNNARGPAGRFIGTRFGRWIAGILGASGGGGLLYWLFKDDGKGSSGSGGGGSSGSGGSGGGTPSPSPSPLPAPSPKEEEEWKRRVGEGADFDDLNLYE